uniref:Tubulin gamma complex component 6 n=1 Tax=Pan troglodytes TaxID=9598 RepID=H2R2P5_PANTR
MFDDLCEALLPAAKTHLARSVNRRGKAEPQEVAYNALSQIFFKNKDPHVVFDLRVVAWPKATVWRALWRRLKQPLPGPLLRGSVFGPPGHSGGSGPLQVLPRKRDTSLTTSMWEKRPYSGYDCDDLSVEMDVQSLISRESWSAMIQETSGYGGCSGTGLPTVGLFSVGDPCGDRSRETPGSRLRALVHSRTIMTGRPTGPAPVPDNADSLAISGGLPFRVASPPSVDQWEDEGFQSSEPSVTPDPALTYEASKRMLDATCCCWNRGCPPWPTEEEPYLRRREEPAFRQVLQRLRQGELQAACLGAVLQAPQPCLCEGVPNVLNVLDCGVVSATFSLLPRVRTAHRPPQWCGALASWLTCLSLRGVGLCSRCFCKHIAYDIYVWGERRINWLKLCCSPALLCWSRPSAVPAGSDCAAYGWGAMERVARHSCLSQELRMEIAKQELIAHAREAASRVLSALSDRQMSERMALDARKREQFQRLKEQFVKDQERRQAARQEELDDDFSYARELRDRERRLKSLEEELERKARQALVDHYSKLSAEAARREQKALWRIQRHRLESARLRFLLEDEKHIQEMLKAVSEAHQPQEPPDVLLSVHPQVTSPGPEHPEGGQGCDSGSAEQHSPAWDGRNRPGLLTPQPLKPLAVGAGGTGLQQAEEARPFSDSLSIGDFLPVGPGAEPSVQTGMVPLLEVALQTINLDLPPSAPGEAPAAASTQLSRPQEYDFSTVLRPAVATSPAPGPLQAAKCSLGSSGLQLWEDSCGKMDACGSTSRETLLPSHPSRRAALEEGSSQPTERLFGQVSGGGLPTGDFASEIAPARPRWNTHGHVSDASIRVGENVSDVAPTRPRWNTHGHVSNASISIGESVSDVAPTRPRWNIHGHVSNASIRVGENVSDVAPTRPRWNTHGHVSNASIRVGENVSDVAPTRPRWNTHGHVSDASISLGESVSDVAPARPQWNTHGHVSDASISLGESVSDMAPTRPRWNTHGHVSDASIRFGENVSDVAPIRSRCNTHGHVSDASISLGEPVSDVVSTRPRWNTHVPIPPPHMVLGAPSPEAEPNTPRPQQSPPGHTSQSALSLGAQSTVLDCGPRLPVEVGPSLSSPSSGCGEGSISVGENVSDVAPTQPWWPNTPGDSVSEELGPGRSGDTEDLSPNWPLNSQEDTAAQSSPGRGEEQAYLAGLAGQYHLERYPDSYESMSEPPIAHLLRPVLPRAFAFPVDPQVQSAADETAVQLSELLTLPVLMKRSITAPLAAHISLVNKAAVDYFFVELHLEAHYEALRHFLLMEDGEFAQSLSDLLFEKLGAGQTPRELLNPLVLNSVLSKALQCSLHGDTPHASNLSLALKYLPEVFAPNAPDVLSCLELRYKVDWPLNIVITEGCLSKYSGVFSFLLQLKLMMWALKDVCFHLKRTALLSHMAGSVQFRQLQLFKHEMQHFVKVIQGYIANQILHVTWCEFRARLATVGDLEEIQRAHAEYLHKAVFRGLLTEKAAPVMNVIHSIFSLVLKFRSQLISQAWGPAGGPRGAEHPNFALMQQSYNTFKYYSHFLFKVVTKLVNRGYQPHLEDFLLRINFNNYYQDA